MTLWPKRGDLDKSTNNVGGLLADINNGRSGDSYWRCLDCEQHFLTEDQAEGHLNEPTAYAGHSARTGVAEYHARPPDVGIATGMIVWPSDVGGTTYDSRATLRAEGLKEGVDFRLPPPRLPPPQRTRTPVVGQQTGPLVDADEGALIKTLRGQMVELRSQLRAAITQRDHERAALNASLSEADKKDARIKALTGQISYQVKRIEEGEEEVAALRATVVDQAAALKALRRGSLMDPSEGFVDVDALPDHLRTAVHKLRELIDYAPLMLRGSEPAALTGEAIGWILADVIGGGHAGEYAIYSITGDVYRSPRGEIDDDTGVIIPGTGGIGR